MEKQETKSLPVREPYRYNPSRGVAALLTLLIIGGLDRLWQHDVNRLLIVDLISFSAMAFIGLQYHDRFRTRGWKAAAVPIFGY